MPLPKGLSKTTLFPGGGGLPALIGPASPRLNLGTCSIFFTDLSILFFFNNKSATILGYFFCDSESLLVPCFTMDILDKLTNSPCISIVDGVKNVMLLSRTVPP